MPENEMIIYHQKVKMRYLENNFTSNLKKGISGHIILQEKEAFHISNNFQIKELYIF